VNNMQPQTRNDFIASLNAASPINGLQWPLGEIPVPLSVDGRHYVAGLELNTQEHLRREQEGLGALTSTGLLHALWELPYGLTFPTRSFKIIDRTTLLNADHGWVEERRDGLVRKYQPIGSIRSITVSDKSLTRAVAKAASHPPTVRRTAIWFTSTAGASSSAVAALGRARIIGVGVIAIDGTRTIELVAAADAMRSRPVVFRWWQAELAYRNWINSREPTGSVEAWD